MSAATTKSSSDSVSMEFAGPVPAVLGGSAGHHVVFWVQASGGAGFTRPSQEECDYYRELGRPVPEWQCEYFEFDGVSWPEAALTVEFWCGRTKLRSLCLPNRRGRREEEIGAELPELELFLHKHGLSTANLAASLYDAVLRAAETAGVIQRGGVTAAPRSGAATKVVLLDAPWWYRALRRAWARTRAMKAKEPTSAYSPSTLNSHEGSRTPLISAQVATGGELNASVGSVA
jgi:hypothetical protein